MINTPPVWHSMPQDGEGPIPLLCIKLRVLIEWPELGRSETVDLIAGQPDMIPAEPSDVGDRLVALPPDTDDSNRNGK
jgi:hypothetical protein